MRSMRLKVGVEGSTIVAAVALTMAVSLGEQRRDGRSGTASAESPFAAPARARGNGLTLKLGGIDMLIPGVDFTTIGKVAAAYFACVNDNGGIHGHRISYTLYNEQLNPAQEARSRAS